MKPGYYTTKRNGKLSWQCPGCAKVHFITKPVKEAVCEKCHTKVTFVNPLEEVE